MLLLCYGQSQDKDEIRLQFLVPQESELNFIYHQDHTIPAAMLAVSDINKNQDYLPEYKLTIDFADTRVSISSATVYHYVMFIHPIGFIVC